MMFKSKAIFLSLATLFLTGCQLNLPFFTKKASLQINTNPKATVFINGKHVGQTPFTDDTLKAGEITVKLVPEAAAGSSWETKVALISKVRTVINRDFGPTQDQSSGSILTLEPLPKTSTTALTVIATPDNVVVQLDDQPQGFTPLNLDQVASGEHTLILTAPGYKEKNLSFRTESGYKLTVSAQLARLPLEEDTPLSPPPESTPSASPTPSSKAGPTASPSASTVASASASAKTPPYVEILDNPIGFLRVRANPSTGATELARAYPGQKLPYKNEENNGWYQVEYAAGKTGWVSRGASGEYAKLVQ